MKNRIRLTESDLNRIVKNVIKEQNEGNFKNLKDNQEKLMAASEFFRKMSIELKVDPTLFGNFNQSMNLLLQDIFEKNYQRTGGQID